MEIYELLSKYLDTKVKNRTQVNLTDYELNGSIIKLSYSYHFIYSNGEEDVSKEVSFKAYKDFLKPCKSQSLFSTEYRKAIEKISY